MAAARSNTRGRPRKALTEKAEQFSIRLTPIDKIALEVYARANGLTLSQAAESAVRQVTQREHDAAGKTHADRANEVKDSAVAIGFSMFEGGDALTEKDIHEAGEVIHFLLSDANGKLLVMPRDTLTESERYFADVVKALGPVKVLRHLRLIRLKCDLGFQAQAQQADVVKSLRGSLDLS